MVTRAGRYFGVTFKGYRGVTQGDLLYPTIFNMVVKTIIHHWLTVVVPITDGLEGRYL